MPDWRLVSPYLALDSETRWLRGNHHGHSTRSDGRDEPQANIDAYDQAGYDYLALSEHDIFCDPAEYDPRRMQLLPAVEVTTDIGQTLMYLGAGSELPDKGSLDLAEVSEFVSGRGGLFIVDHPNWRYRQDRLHATAEEMLEVEGLAGIEIYTGVIERLAGSPLATDVWDRLPTAGRRVYGHATDDQHEIVDRFLGWNAVQWQAGEPVVPAGIIAALRDGRFVASTGPAVSAIGIGTDGKSIHVASDAQRLRWMVRDGILAEVTEGGSGVLHVDRLLSAARVSSMASRRNWSSPADLAYVRVECCGPAGTTAWSQPFFIEAA